MARRSTITVEIFHRISVVSKDDVALVKKACSFFSHLWCCIFFVRPWRRRATSIHYAMQHDHEGPRRLCMSVRAGGKRPFRGPLARSVHGSDQPNNNEASRWRRTTLRCLKGPGRGWSNSVDTPKSILRPFVYNWIMPGDNCVA
jgi:hypothetical protein